MNKLLLTLCCAALASVAGHAQMVISPSEESYRAALATLEQPERAQVENGLPRRVDASNASLEEPKSETSKRSTADIYQLEWSSFFAKMNETATFSSAVVILKTTTLTRMLADTGNDTPRFTIQIEWRPAKGGSISSARGRATGPTYKGRGRDSKNPVAIRSANIAFYAAFLKAMAQIAAQVQSEASPSTPQPGQS